MQFTTLSMAFSLASLALAVAPQCSQPGHSEELTNGTYPFFVQSWTKIQSQSACRDLCWDAEGCYASAYSSNRKECHGYSNVVGYIGVHDTGVDTYLFSDNCCPLPLLSK